MEKRAFSRPFSALSTMRVPLLALWWSSLCASCGGGSGGGDDGPGDPGAAPTAACHDREHRAGDHRSVRPRGDRRTGGSWLPSASAAWTQDRNGDGDTQGQRRRLHRHGDRRGDRPRLRGRRPGADDGKDLRVPGYGGRPRRHGPKRRRRPGRCGLAGLRSGSSRSGPATRSTRAMATTGLGLPGAATEGGYVFLEVRGLAGTGPQQRRRRAGQRRRGLGRDESRVCIPTAAGDPRARVRRWWLATGACCWPPAKRWPPEGPQPRRRRVRRLPLRRRFQPRGAAAAARSAPCSRARSGSNAYNLTDTAAVYLVHEDAARARPISTATPTRWTRWSPCGTSPAAPANTSPSRRRCPPSGWRRGPSYGVGTSGTRAMVALDEAGSEQHGPER